jgi:hypothetical protein
MAEIKSLIEVKNKNIPLESETAADYCFDGEHFSIWSYKNGDINRNGSCPQNMQFDKEKAKTLRDALNRFLLDT